MEGIAAPGLSKGGGERGKGGRGGGKMIGLSIAVWTSLSVSAVGSINGISRA